LTSAGFRFGGDEAFAREVHFGGGEEDIRLEEEGGRREVSD